MKKLFLICATICALGLFSQSLFAQHQTFMGVELGGNPELFKYEMKQRGFYESNKEGYDCLYGKYLTVDCRLWVKEENNVVKELVLNYRYEENMSEARAKSVAEGVVMIICKELQERKIKYFVVEDTYILGSSKGTVIRLENGNYGIRADGSITNSKEDWMVFVSINDMPNNPLFEHRLQQEKERLRTNNNKRK